jgi:hypothetical protein
MNQVLHTLKITHAVILKHVFRGNRESNDSKLNNGTAKGMDGIINSIDDKINKQQ